MLKNGLTARKGDVELSKGRIWREGRNGRCGYTMSAVVMEGDDEGGRLT